MVEMNFKSFAISAILIGIFVISLLSFGNQMAIDNNSTNIIQEEEYLNRAFSGMNNTLTDAEDSIDSQREGFFKDVPVIGEISVILGSIVSVGRVFTGVIRNIYDLTIGMITEALGISTLVMGLLTSIILISVILLAWRVYRSGA